MPGTSQSGGLWSDVRAAVAGHHQDYTRGPIGRAVLLLAIPMVLEMAMQSLFSVVDVYFIGRLGYDAVAVAGLTDSLLALVFAVAIGLSMGTSAMVARRIGEGDPERAARSAVQAMALGTALSIIVGIAGVMFTGDLLRLLGASEELVTQGSGFTAIMLGGNVTVVLLFLVNAVFRGAGDAVGAMRALWVANGINIVLDPILIFGLGPIPALGLEGAAIATTLARGLGVAYQLRRLASPGGRVHVHRRHLALDLEIMRRLVRVSAIGVLQFLISTTSFVWMFRILATFGAQALAGYTIAIRLILFVLLPAWGMGNAAATLVGQNLGANNPQRAERSAWLTARANTVFLGLVAIVFVLFAEGLTGLFTTDPAVIEVSASCLRIIGYSYVFWGFGMITVLAFNGAGDTTTPTWINLFAYWMLQLPLAYGLAIALEWGPAGVFVAIAVAQVALAAMGVILFRRGSWKSRVI